MPNISPLSPMVWEEEEMTDGQNIWGWDQEFGVTRVRVGIRVYVGISIRIGIGIRDGKIHLNLYPNPNSNLTRTKT